MAWTIAVVWLGRRRSRSSTIHTFRVAAARSPIGQMRAWERLAAFWWRDRGGRNKRLRTALPLLQGTIQALARDTDLWAHPIWVTNFTPVERGHCRPTTRGFNLAGWAGYDYCHSRSRFFWGLWPHLIRIPAGLPTTWALDIPGIDERQVLMAICDHDPALLVERPALLIIADKGYMSGSRTATWANRMCGCCGLPFATAPAPASSSSHRSADSSNRSTTPSNAN